MSLEGHSSVPVEIPGILAPPQMARQFQFEVARLLQRENNRNFPGSQPVSFGTRHLQTLREQDYYVCEKSDGIRCLLYCTEGDGGEEVHYLIDRKNDYYFVQGLHFPVPEDPSFVKFHIDTLIDGELVLDKERDGSTVLRYLVFDCLMIDGKPLMQRPLDKRLGYLREHLYKPFQKLCAAFPTEVPFFPFILEFKPMQRAYALQMMFDQVLPSLKHGNDGLIFTCCNSPYKFGTDETLLKWKPAEENSIDFRLMLDFPSLDDEDDPAALDYDAIPRCKLGVFLGQGQNPYDDDWAELYVDEEIWEHLKSYGVPLDEAIIECAKDERGRWRFKRFRNDKKDANHVSTVRSVLASIEDAVSKEDLLRAEGGIRSAWKVRHGEPVQR